MVRKTAILAIALGISGAANAAIQASFQPTRTSGVAPLAVLFDATATTATGANAFHDLYYGWTFGDPNAGTWTYSITSKNVSSGPLTAHVFETPGTYTVTLTVKDATGQTASKSTTITVSDPNVVFSGAATTCVSASGSFAGCPSGAQQVTTNTFSGAMAYAGTGRRVLLRRGDAFALGGSVTFNAPGPATVGAFGSGGAPVIDTAGVTTSVIKVSGNTALFEDWRIMDLEFRNPASSSSVVLANGSTQRLLVQRVKATGFHVNVLLNTNISSRLNQPMHEEIFLVENNWSSMQGGAGGNGVYLGANRLAILGNRIDDARNVEHVIRLVYAGWAVISHNYLARPATQKHVIKYHALGHSSSFSFPERDSHDFVISENIFASDDNNNNVAIGPQNDFEDERVHQGIFERNLSRAAPGHRTHLNVWASQVSVRNNVFDSSSAGEGTVGARVARRAIEPLPTGDLVHNNTCYATNYPVVCVEFLVSQSNAASNNLTVGPTGSSVGVAGNASQLLASSPFVSGSPSTFADFRLDPTKSVALIDAGVATNGPSIDALGVLRPVDGNNDGIAKLDIGALEYGTPASGGGTVPPPTAPPATAPAAPVLLP